MPFVGQAEGKGVKRTLPFCVFKLRNFETSHRGNATETLAWVDYIPSIAILINNV